MTNKEALAELHKMSLDLANVEYDSIIDLMKHSIKKIPIPLAWLAPKTAIDRARKNNGNTLFTNVHDQLSYIRDPGVIANHLTEFGRANKPHQPLFYGAIPSIKVETQRITAIAETSALFQDKDGVNLTGELYTVSRWLNTDKLSIAEVVFSQAAIDANPDIKRSFDNQRRFASEAGFADMDFYTDLLIFLSDQFAREKKLTTTIKYRLPMPTLPCNTQMYRASHSPAFKPTTGVRTLYSHLRQSTTIYKSQP